MAPPEAFNFTATGVLGDKRDTMLENELLLRCQLSQPMKRGYTHFPGQSYCYGKPNAIKDGGAAEALSGWPVSSNKGTYFHKKSAGKEIRPDRDFVAMNRSAVEHGLTTSREQSDFRATHDIRRKVQTESANGKNKQHRIPASMVFGVATRPSTPIHDLLEHKYQDRWVEERKTVELLRKSKNQSNKLDPSKLYSNRATRMRHQLAPIQSAPLWHLPKFANKATPQLETFRSASAKERSFSHYQHDKLGRKGMFGHGIPEPAVY